MTAHFRTAIADGWSFHFQAVSLTLDDKALERERTCTKIDCRVLSDPSNDPALRDLPVNDPKLLRFIRSSSGFNELWSEVSARIDRRKRTGGKMKINFVCTDGKQRSGAMVELANEYALTEFKH